MVVDMTKDPKVEREWTDRAFYIRQQRADFAEWRATLHRQGGGTRVSLVKR